MGLRDLLRPFESRQLQGLGPALQGGMDPQLAYQLMQSVIGGAQDRQTQRRASFGTAADSLTQAAASGAPSTALPGLASVYGAAAGLGPQGTGRLEDLVGKLYPDQGGTSALYQGTSGTTPGVLPPDQLAAVDADLKAMATGLDGDGNPLPQTYTAHTALMHVMQGLRAGGITDPATLDAVRRFVEQRWNEYHVTPSAG